MKHFKIYIFIFFINLFATSIYSAERCDLLKTDFTKLYIALQNSLNYEGKDAISPNGKGVKLVNHTVGKSYEGKLFQEMLFTQYQNSLKKVAALILKIGNKKDTNEVYDQNDIISFFKNIDQSSYNDSNIKKLLDSLELRGKAEFKDEQDKIKILNNNDKYLLEKLLIHSKDKICSVEKNKSKSKKNQILVELQQYPLNRMVYALKNAKLKGGESIDNIKSTNDITGDKIKTTSISLKDGVDQKNSNKFEIVDAEKTIQSAVLDNLHTFEKWLSKHESCRSYFMKSNGNFIQGGIQSCNYKKFISALNGTESDFEKILHFINANQKPKLKAETNIDPNLLESYIDNAIKTSKIPNCEKIGDAIFVRNLVYNNKSFDPKENKFECSIKSTAVDCNKSIKLISDDLGRGIKIVPTSSSVKFKIPNTNCNEDLIDDSQSTKKDEPTECDPSKGKCPKEDNEQLKQQEQTKENSPKKDDEQKVENDKDNTKENERKACEDLGFTYNPEGTTPTEKCFNKKARRQQVKDEKENENESPDDPFKEFLNSIGNQGQPNSQRFIPQQIPSRPIYISPGLR